MGVLDRAFKVYPVSISHYLCFISDLQEIRADRIQSSEHDFPALTEPDVATLPDHQGPDAEEGERSQDTPSSPRVGHRRDAAHETDFAADVLWQAH